MKLCKKRYNAGHIPRDNVSTERSSCAKHRWKEDDEKSDLESGVHLASELFPQSRNDQKLSDCLGNQQRHTRPLKSYYERLFNFSIYSYGDQTPVIDNLSLHHMNLVSINNKLLTLSAIITKMEGPTEEQLVS